MFFTCVGIAAIITEIFAVNYADTDQVEVVEKTEIAAIDYYDFTLRLHIPRIYNNSTSLGYRKYQLQTIVGEMQLQYDKFGDIADIVFTNMVNKTQKLSNGSALTYPRSYLDNIVYPRFNAIGNNKTKIFKTASICFNLAAEPNYNIGEFNEDNGLYIQLSGKGTFDTYKYYLKRATGYVTGTLGCGCMAYGHVSPTRKITYFGPQNAVDDVAAVYGRWTIKINKKKSKR